MPNHFQSISEAGVRLFVRAGRRVAAAVLAVGLAAILAATMASPLAAQMPTTPAEAYGPFNAVFLADGSGLNKTLSPATSLDGVWAVAMDGQGSGQPSIQDPLLAGRAVWTLAFWFESQVPIQGTALLAGIGRSCGGGCALYRRCGQSTGPVAGKGAKFRRVCSGQSGTRRGKVAPGGCGERRRSRGALRRWPRSGREQAGAGQRCAGSGDGAAAAAECCGEPLWRQRLPGSGFIARR